MGFKNDQQRKAAFARLQDRPGARPAMQDRLREVGDGKDAQRSDADLHAAMERLVDDLNRLEGADYSVPGVATSEAAALRRLSQVDREWDRRHGRHTVRDGFLGPWRLDTAAMKTFSPDGSPLSEVTHTGNGTAFSPRRYWHATGDFVGMGDTPGAAFRNWVHGDNKVM